ncbi:hypothetical protein [Gordonia alkaliphila]|uniref:Uncharacterized protein n=1 Tax=Gordonia alkaliphila TaxID=1053547 RepID=A0ABP8YXZ2_9ACTN
MKVNEDRIIERVAAIQAHAGFRITGGDLAALRRVLRGATTVEQEKEAVLAELAAARGGPIRTGEAIKGNLLGLTDAAELHVAERRIVSLRMAQLVADPGAINHPVAAERPGEGP